MNVPMPGAAATLLKKLDGWSIEHSGGSSGTVTTTALGEPRGDGTCPRVEVATPADCYVIRAVHVDGRAFVATWVHRQGNVSKTGAPVWTVDTIWRGRHLASPEDWTPKQLTSTELKAYIGADDAAAGLAAIEQLRDELARKRATKRGAGAPVRGDGFGEVA